MNLTSVSPDQLAHDPAWLPDRLDWKTRTVQFARLERAAIEREAFLDDRKASAPLATATISALAPHVTAPIRPPAFIFHTAFCCSTLLARAVDHPGTALALREPNVTMDLANAYRMAGSDHERREIDAAKDIILALLSRAHQGDERVVIKPTNTANNLAPLIAQTTSPIIFLYGDLQGFLISVLKKGEACKAFVRTQYNIFALDKVGVAAIPQRQAISFTDLQIAALVWRHQMELFSQTLQSSTTLAKSLDFRTLLDRPQETLAAASDHFALSLSQASIAETVAGPVFATNSKFDDKSYDAGARARDENDLLSRHREEIAMIETWAANVQLAHAVPSPLPKPLA